MLMTEGFRMKDDFKQIEGFDNIQTDRQTDICDCRVVVATEHHEALCIKS